MSKTQEALVAPEEKTIYIITLIGLRDARLWVKVFLGGSVTLFPEEISI